jgi:hypothetical protein
MDKAKFLSEIDWEEVKSKLEQKVPDFEAEEMVQGEIKIIRGHIGGEWINFEFSIDKDYPFADAYTDKYIEGPESEDAVSKLNEYIKESAMCDEFEYQEGEGRYAVTCVSARTAPPEQVSERLRFIPKDLAEITVNLKFPGGPMEERLVDAAKRAKDRLDTEFAAFQDTF